MHKHNVNSLGSPSWLARETKMLTLIEQPASFLLFSKTDFMTIS